MSFYHISQKFIPMYFKVCLVWFSQFYYEVVLHSALLSPIFSWDRLQCLPHDPERDIVVKQKKSKKTHSNIIFAKCLKFRFKYQ